MTHSPTPSTSSSSGENPADRAAAERAVYADLHRAAQRLRARERSDLTMRTTGLVHEAYLALQKSGLPWPGDSDGDAVSPDLYVYTMRRVLVGVARRRNRAKRGGGVRPLSLSDRDVAAGGRHESVEDWAHLAVDLDRAMDRLRRVDERAHRVVELKFFAGLDQTQIAEILGVTTKTVQRDWNKAQAYLHVYVQEWTPETDEQVNRGLDGQPPAQRPRAA